LNLLNFCQDRYVLAVPQMRAGAVRMDASPREAARKQRRFTSTCGGNVVVSLREGNIRVRRICITRNATSTGYRVVTP